MLYRHSTLIFKHVIHVLISFEFFLHVSILEIIAGKNFFQYQQEWNQPKFYNKIILFQL
jgi:hypothetical protein